MALFLAKFLGVLLILAVAGATTIAGTIMLLVEFITRIFHAVFKSDFGKSGGVIAIAFGGAVWCVARAFQN